MSLIKNILILLISSALMFGCGVAKQSARAPGAGPAADTGAAAEKGGGGNEAGPESVGPVAAMNVSAVNKTKTSLVQAYHDWKGTPYLLGGASESGVDCSMFINIVFADYFDIDLPTNTRTQLNAGEGIRRAAIQTGDLIFFRTGRGSLHVGVMLNREEFLHASTSEGVTISDVSQKYWANRYLAARRVL